VRTVAAIIWWAALGTVASALGARGQGDGALGDAGGANRRRRTGVSAESRAASRQRFYVQLGYSRARYLEFTDTQALAALLACHERAFRFLGGVPKDVLYDRLNALTTPGRLQPSELPLPEIEICGSKKASVPLSYSKRRWLGAPW
jgi:hypothetical protein